MTQPRILSLFSGIGALDLAVEIVTGGKTITQVEAVPYRRAVLAKHWPDATRHDDVCTFSAKPGEYDIICGGFPCRDISQLGSKKGLAGKHSGLWFEYLRIIEECQPRAVFIENVANLRTRGLDRVLQDLAALRFDAAWTTSEAREAGRPLWRPRLFLLACTAPAGLSGSTSGWLGVRESHTDRCDVALPQPTDREGCCDYDGPSPGVYRATGRAARGLDERRRRARVGSLGDTVVVAQAVMSYRWCAQQLSEAHG